MAFIFSNSSLCISKVNAAVVLPKVTFIGIEHSPLVQGDSEKFYLTANNANIVQYRIFFYSQSANKWDELTNGYIFPVNAKIPYVIAPPKTFAIGKYKLSVWVKRANTTGAYRNKNGDYDSYYTANLNCVNRDDSRRVYPSGDLDMPKDTYVVGEKVVISGIKGINGKAGPYKYKLHLYNATKNIWIKDVTAYTGTIEWTPSEAGTYVADVWALSANPIAKYEAWKLKTITVVNDPNTYGNTSGNLSNGGFVAEQGNWVYYTNSTNKLYRQKADGTGKTKLSDDITSNINIAGDWLYYVNVSDTGKIYKIKTDGTGKAVVDNTTYSGCSTFNINVVGDYIYFSVKGNASSASNGLYRIKTDGSERIKLSNKYCYFIGYAVGKIYFIDNDSLRYMINPDGTNLQNLN